MKDLWGVLSMWGVTASILKCSKLCVPWKGKHQRLQYIQSPRGERKSVSNKRASEKLRQEYNFGIVVGREAAARHDREHL